MMGKRVNSTDQHPGEGPRQQLRPITLLSLLSVFETVQNGFFFKRKRVEYDEVHL